MSEPLVLVIGGGLGAGYILWEFKARAWAILVLGFRNRWQYPAIPGWTGNVLDRLAIPADVHETGGAVGARAALDGLLDDRTSVLTWVDQQTMGTWGYPPELSGYWGYPVVVVGRTPGGAYLVDDRGDEPLVVDGETLAAARARIVSYKHRLIVPRPTTATLTEERLRSALLAGLSDQVEHLRSTSDSFSLPAWRKWSRLMTDRRQAKGWPTVFDGGDGLFGTLLSVVEAVDGAVGAGGGHLRDLYADGLDVSAGILDRPGLHEAASRWREAADRWEDLADAAIPAWLPDGLDAVAAAERLHAAVMRGEPGRADATAAAAELWAIRDAHGGPLDVTAGEIADLFEDLGERLAAIHAAEVAAVDATAEGLAAG
jgi:hypothetical protein